MQINVGTEATSSCSPEVTRNTVSEGLTPAHAITLLTHPAVVRGGDLGCPTARFTALNMALLTAKRTASTSEPPSLQKPLNLSSMRRYVCDGYT